MKNISSFKDFEKLNEEFKKDRVTAWLQKMKGYSKREAEETRIASKILRKIIRKNLGMSPDKPTADEIKFLKDHSKDLMKILGFIATSPTPIPYTLISVMLKKAGLANLFPSKDDLDIPDEYKKSKDENELS